MTQPDSTTSRRGERILAYMFTAMVAVTVLAIVLLVCSAFFGNSGNFDQGLWPVIAITPLIALPLAFILAVALFIVVARRRAADAASAAPCITAESARRTTAKTAPGATSSGTPARVRTARSARASRTK